MQTSGQRKHISIAPQSSTSCRCFRFSPTGSITRSKCHDGRLSRGEGGEEETGCACVEGVRCLRKPYRRTKSLLDVPLPRSTRVTTQKRELVSLQGFLRFHSPLPFHIGKGRRPWICPPHVSCLLSLRWSKQVSGKGPNPSQAVRQASEDLPMA